PLGTNVQDPQAITNDPCSVSPNIIPSLAAGEGGGWPVSDAVTEANTGAILDQASAIQHNTDAIAQLLYQHCEAERAARAADIQNATAPSPWQDTGPDTQAPGAN